MVKLFDKLFFQGPSSLGDAFVMNGLIHYYADRCNELHYPVLPKYIKTLASLYKSWPNIIIIGVEPYDKGENQYVEALGLSRILRPPVWGFSPEDKVLSVPLWDRQVYDLSEIPYHFRYTNFRLPELEEAKLLYNKVKEKENYILVATGAGKHKSLIVPISNYREHIKLPDDVQVINVDDLSDNMMDYTELIKNASEIHCVPSAFYCLVENMHKMTKAKLFIHNIRKSTLMSFNTPWNSVRWNIVDYKTKLNV